jgi:two-component system cell cycle response regulator
VRLLEAKLANEFFDVITAPDGITALRLAREESPDIILLDVMMPGMDGFTVCRKLKSDPATNHIPIVLVTALSDTKDRVEGLLSGADDFLTKPVHDIPLFARVRSLIRLKMMIEEWRSRDKTARQFGVLDTHPETIDDGLKGAILLIEQDAIEATNIVDILTQNGHEILGATQMENAFQLSQQRQFNLIMVSASANETTALRLCSRFRAQEATRHTPILLLSDTDDRLRLAQALDLGVNDYIITPADKDELLARTRIQVRRSRYQDKLRANFEQSLTLALTDTLTGLYNRRYFNTHIQEMVNRAYAGGKTLACLAIDIDHFKKVNDTHGHAAGDAVLKEIGARMARNVRNLDLVARLGGEEFVLVMPDTTNEIALMIADRMRLMIANEPVIISPDVAVSVSVSVGLCVSNSDDQIDGEELLARADQALYKAKESGRNKVVVWSEPGKMTATSK